MTHHTAGELAQFLGCEIHGDPQLKLRGVSNPDQAGPEDLVYLDAARHAERVLRSAARCVVTSPELPVPGKTTIIVRQPKLAFSRAAEWLAPAAPIASGVHPSAVIAASARLAPGVAVGPFAVIEDDASIGAGTEIGAFCFLGRGAKLGEACRIYPRVTLYAGASLGNRVMVHSGAVIGADGFGYVSDEQKHWKFPQVGRVEIGDDVEIGSNTTIDRGSLDVTRLGPQVKLDNLVHVAHNVQIGERTLIAAQTGIAGSCVIGRNVVIGGQAGLGDHCRLEDGCVAGGQSGILNGKTIRSGQTVWGTPARPLAQFKEQFAWFARLPQLAKRLRNLEGGKQEEH